MKVSNVTSFTFTKMHGIGNDFIVIDDRDNQLSFTIEEVIKLCDRRFGIGADGLMLLRKSNNEHADFTWWFVNNDGSVPEMCGNGSRCLARFVYDHKLLPAGATSFVLETLSGLKKIDILTHEDGSFKAARVNMGTALSLPDAIPTTLGSDDSGQVLHQTFKTLSGREVIGNCVNVGNPHLVLFLDENPGIDADDIFYQLGPELEQDPHFPTKINVEFITVNSPSHMTMRVWERGVGETLACGTGACASAFAALLTGRTVSHVTVSLAGGDLDVEITENHEIFMTGEAREVFTGTFDATI